MEIFSYTIPLSQLILLAIAVMFIGMSKTGVPGAGMVSIPLVVIIFGSKASTGILLPLLIFADMFAIYHYHRFANWQHLKHLLPLTVVGIILASILGTLITDDVFKNLMAITIFSALGLMIWQEKNKKPSIPDNKWFVIAIGIIGGFASMIGNLAGPILALYLLAMRFPKKEFIGTGAWFFFSINIFKVPFHIFLWETITLNSFFFDVLLIPSIALGAWLGVRIIHKISETVFRYIVIVVTAIAAVAMFL